MNFMNLLFNALFWPKLVGVSVLELSLYFEEDSK